MPLSQWNIMRKAKLLKPTRNSKTRNLEIQPAHHRLRKRAKLELLQYLLLVYAVRGTVTPARLLHLQKWQAQTQPSPSTHRWLDYHVFEVWGTGCGRRGRLGLRVAPSLAFIMSLFIQSNIRILQANREELSLLLFHYDPTAVCVQETLLRSHRTASFENYSYYGIPAVENNISRHGGVAILVINTILHQQLHINRILACRPLY